MLKYFSKSCPFHHCSLKADLWLRLQFAPFSSLLSLHLWQLDTRHCMAARAEMSFTLLSFTIVLLCSSRSPFLTPSPLLPPTYRGVRVIRVWALVSTPIHLYRCCRGLILQSHIRLSQSTPHIGCFWGGGKDKKKKREKPIGFFVTSIECLRAAVSLFCLAISGKLIFILAWSFDYGNNSVWLHLKCCLAQLWLACQLVLERWVTWGYVMRVCACVREGGRETGREMFVGGKLLAMLYRDKASIIPVLEKQSERDKHWNIVSWKTRSMWRSGPAIFQFNTASPIRVK